MNAADVLQIFNECRTDKGRHGYAPFYASIPPPSVMLEVGVAAGDSLRAWRRIWPDVIVYGVDKDLSTYQGPPDNYTHVMEADAAAENLGIDGFDLIVDDASHMLPDQMAIRDRLFPCLGPSGIYVIEDVTPENGSPLLLEGWSLLVTGPSYDDRLCIWWSEDA